MLFVDSELLSLKDFSSPAEITKWALVTVPFTFMRTSEQLSRIIRLGPGRSGQRFLYGFPPFPTS